MYPAPPLALAYTCLALSMALVGTYVALAKPLVAVLPVFLLAWLRFGIGALAMPHWLIAPPDEAPLTATSHRLLFLQALLGNFLFSIFMLYGVSLCSAFSSGLVLATIPAMVALLSWAWLREPISWRLGLGLGCSVAALGLIAQQQPDQPSASNQELLGQVLVFTAVLCEAAYVVIGKTLSKTLAPKRIAALINLWGLALMTPAGVYLAWDFDFSGLSLASWGLLLFYGLAASVWSVWLWMTGLRAVPAAHSGVFTVMLPLATTLVGLAVLGEEIKPLHGLALALALCGVFLATLAHQKAQRSGPETG